MGVRSSFFDEPCWKKTVVSFRVLSSFSKQRFCCARRRLSRLSESSLSRLSRPRLWEVVKDNVLLCQNVVKTFFVLKREKKRKEEKKEKEKSLITFNLGYQKKKRENSSFVSPKRGVKASKEDAETTTHTHTHTHTTHVCRHHNQHNESLLVDEKTPPKALVFETTGTPFFCVRIVVFKIDAKTTGKGRP